MSVSPGPTAVARAAEVAVAVRTKNRPQLLARALDSIVEQTYTDYLVVVVNDGGAPRPVDEAVAAIAERAAGRITVVHHDRSQGRWPPVNAFLRATSSRYVAVHDDDDRWAPEFLARTVSRLDSGTAAGVGTRVEVVYEQIGPDGAPVETGRELLASDRHDITLQDTIGRNYVPPISLLYRREVHDLVGYYDERQPVLADWDFYLRVLRRFPIAFLDGEPLAFWHRRPTSVGDDGNSVHAGIAEHVLWNLRLRDRYLRTTLAAGNGLGVPAALTAGAAEDRTAARLRGLSAAGEIRAADTLARTTLAPRIGMLGQRLPELTDHLLGTIGPVLAQLRAVRDGVAEQGRQFTAESNELDDRLDLVDRVVGMGAGTPLSTRL